MSNLVLTSAGETTISSVSDEIAARLALFTDKLADAVMLVDSDWRIVYANVAARRNSHMTPSYIGGNLWELYPGLIDTEVGQAYIEVARTGEERIIKDFYYIPFATYFDLHVLPMPDGIAVHYRDLITDVREARAARDATLKQLQQVLATTTDSVVSLDRDFRIVYMNSRARTTLAAGGEVLGQILFDAFPYTVYEDSPYVEIYTRAMLQREEGSFEAFYPEPFNFWLHVTARPSEEGIIIFFRDVTEQKSREAALIRSEKLAAVGRLASSIAHEINNPLESVMNLIYIARQYAIAPEVETFLDLADQELRRVAVISNQTLRFHKQTTKPQTVRWEDLLSSVLSIYEARLKNSRIQVETRRRDLNPILCFQGEIRQVLNNLVSNSIDAMPKGGRLILRSREATNWRTGQRGSILTVADTGAGIDPQNQSRIFEAFFTTKGIQGTGLGLWISCEIIDRHHGTIRMRSNQHETTHGTVFTLFLPYETEPSSAPSITVA